MNYKITIISTVVIIIIIVIFFIKRKKNDIPNEVITKRDVLKLELSEMTLDEFKEYLQLTGNNEYDSKKLYDLMTPISGFKIIGEQKEIDKVQNIIKTFNLKKLPDLQIIAMEFYTELFKFYDHINGISRKLDTKIEELKRLSGMYKLGTCLNKNIAKYTYHNKNYIVVYIENDLLENYLKDDSSNQNFIVKNDSKDDNMLKKIYNYFIPGEKKFNYEKEFETVKKDLHDASLKEPSKYFVIKKNGTMENSEEFKKYLESLN